MNRIDELFRNKKHQILSVYFTAGYPNLNDTIPIISALAKNGVDMIEIGIPFSDPMADGPVIQQSSNHALKNGMNLHLLFEQLREVRSITNIPLLLMGYLNPVMQFGMDNFLEQCSLVGIDGVILPDLPLQEYCEEYKSRFEQHEIYNIFLISPHTATDRIQQIDEVSRGFVYTVSSSGTTGAKLSIEQNQEKYFERIAALKLHNPTVIGFGISNKATFDKACQHAAGAIIGSAFIKALSNATDIEQTICDFIKPITQ